MSDRWGKWLLKGGLMGVLIWMLGTSAVIAGGVKPIKLSELRFNSLTFLSQEADGDWVEGRLVNGSSIFLHDSDHLFRSALIQINKKSLPLLTISLNVYLTGIDYIGQGPSEEVLLSLLQPLIPHSILVEKEINLSQVRILAERLAQLTKQKKLVKSQSLAVIQ